jgi:hypothetical protein
MLVLLGVCARLARIHYMELKEISTLSPSLSLSRIHYMELKVSRASRHGLQEATNPLHGVESGNEPRYEEC